MFFWRILSGMNCTLSFYLSLRNSLWHNCGATPVHPMATPVWKMARPHWRWWCEWWEIVIVVMSCDVAVARFHAAVLKRHRQLHESRTANDSGPVASISVNSPTLQLYHWLVWCIIGRCHDNRQHRLRVSVPRHRRREKFSPQHNFISDLSLQRTDVVLQLKTNKRNREKKKMMHVRNFVEKSWKMCRKVCCEIPR